MYWCWSSEFRQKGKKKYKNIILVVQSCSNFEITLIPKLQSPSESPLLSRNEPPELTESESLILELSSSTSIHQWWKLETTPYFSTRAFLLFFQRRQSINLILWTWKWGNRPRPSVWGCMYAVLLPYIIPMLLVF